MQAQRSHASTVAAAAAGGARAHRDVARRHPAAVLRLCLLRAEGQGQGVLRQRCLTPAGNLCQQRLGDAWGESCIGVGAKVRGVEGGKGRTSLTIKAVSKNAGVAAGAAPSSAQQRPAARHAMHALR